MSSGDGEGVPGALGVLVDALEPPLVADLDLQDVDLAARDCRRDELVAAALIAVGCRAGEGTSQSMTSGCASLGRQNMANRKLA